MKNKEGDSKTTWLLKEVLKEYPIVLEERVLTHEKEMKPLNLNNNNKETTSDETN